MKRQVSVIKDCICKCEKALEILPGIAKQQRESMHSGLAVICGSMAEEEKRLSAIRDQYKMMRRNAENGQY